MNDPFSNLASYFELMTANGAARLFHVAAELGILDTLARGPITAGELSVQNGLDLRPCELLLKCLAAMNLVTESDAVYSPSPLLEMVGGRYRDLGDSYWDHLPEFLKSGEPLMRMDDPSANAGIYREQVQSLAWMMQPSAMAAARAVVINSAADRVRVLDVGCGAAVWSMAFAAAYPNVQVVANDWPPVLEIARQAVEASGVADRYEYLSGNYHEADFTDVGKFDVILLGNVTHLQSKEQNVALFSRLRQVLTDSGRLVVLDILPEEKEHLTAALYEMGLALRTQLGAVFSAPALAEMLEAAGFRESKFTTLPTPPHVMGMVEGWS